MGKIDNNKQQKRDSLLESAFSLFINNGFNKTSISDIVNRAGVAKGTFYLYFKDKYDIRNNLIAHKAGQVFHAAYLALQEHPELTDFEARSTIHYGMCREFRLPTVLHASCLSRHWTIRSANTPSLTLLAKATLPKSARTSTSKPSTSTTHLSV